MSPLAPDLKIGETLLIFQISGKLPAVSDELYITVKGRAINSDASLANLTGFFSGPLALPFFSPVSATKICRVSTVLKLVIVELLSLILAKVSSVDFVLISSARFGPTETKCMLKALTISLLLVKNLPSWFKLVTDSFVEFLSSTLLIVCRFCLGCFCFVQLDLNNDPVLRFGRLL